MRRPVLKSMRHFLANDLYHPDWPAFCKEGDPVWPFLQMISITWIGRPVIKRMTQCDRFCKGSVSSGLSGLMQRGWPSETVSAYGPYHPDYCIVSQLIWSVWMGWPIVKWIVWCKSISQHIWIIQLGWGCWLSRGWWGTTFFLQMNRIIWMMQPVAKRRARKGKEFNSVILLMVNTILLLVNIDP